MNILFLTREYKHEKLDNCGGTGNFIATLSKQLVKNGHTVYVYGVNKNEIEFNDNQVKIKFEKSIFKKYPVINLWRSITGKIKFLEKYHNKIHLYEKRCILKKLAKHIVGLEIDLIETHDFEGMLLCIENKMPTIVRCHGSWSILEKYFGYKAEKGKIYCEKKSFEIAKNVITISEFSKEINTKLFGVINSKLIYNGVDTELFKPITSIEIIPKSIFHFGNTSIEKGADISIKSFIEIIKTEPRASLHFLGKETEYKNEIINIAKENKIEDKISFYGIQNSENVINLLSKAEIVLFPSKGENFSLALLEAMSMSKIVICSNIPAFNEVINDEENGFIATDYIDFSNKILFYFNNNINKIGTNARQYVELNFSLNKMVIDTLEYYKKVIANN